MEQFPSGSSRRRVEQELSVREQALRARIGRENSKSGRFLASHIRSFREDGRSFGSNVTISSTASSPGYTLREEIDPATYSFTTALKALQARSVYNRWECLSPDGFALNSKWNEAEKYISNPHSGEVPMECLSAKTIAGKSFRSLTTRITISASPAYSSHNRPQVHTRPALASTKQDHMAHFPIQENKIEGMTRDVGTQSTPAELSSNSVSPASTPSIMEGALRRCETEGGDSPNSNNASLKAEDKVRFHSKDKLSFQLALFEGNIWGATNLSDLLVIVPLGYQVI
uniref:Uncharacterized protein n=1 Tax=Rhizophora mucronata TaxID=61149 RepID=A0A2P2J876_RHIMU